MDRSQTRPTKVPVVGSFFNPLGGRSHGEAFVGGYGRRCFGLGSALHLFGREAGFGPTGRGRSSGTVSSTERDRRGRRQKELPLLRLRRSPCGRRVRP